MKYNKLNTVSQIIQRYKTGGDILDEELGELSSNSTHFEKLNNKSLGSLFSKLLQFRDQAHIFHWQTDSNSYHTILGEFYEEYLDEIDKLAESIFGKTGTTFKIAGSKIELVDYSEANLRKFCDEVYSFFVYDFKNYFPNNAKNIDLYHIVGDILEVVNKTKYLMSQK